MMKRSFSRVAIVNRGEAALRFLHAAVELNREGERIHTIALYTEPEAQTLFVREADEAHCLGPATVEAPGGGHVAAYLDLGRLERALRETRAEAAWPGWGFVAEEPAFAELCERLGVTFIGPSPAAMRALADKISAKRLASSLGIPVVPWAGPLSPDPVEAARQVAELGLPVVLKPSTGTGGRGVREADTAERLVAALAEAARKPSHLPIVVERRLDGVRQVDVQVVADAWGGVWALPARDASVQRRHQKRIEESPAPGLSSSREAALRQAAVRLVRAAGYVGAAAVEFLCDQGSEDYWFLEANARLEVEHPVSEVTTGVDLVKMQVHVARGGRLPGEAPAANGHAIEARLCAEDPQAGFAPAPGSVARLRLPGGPGLRVDAGYAEGDVIPAEFDPTIAKLVAHGRDREEALGRLARALSQTAVVLRGGTTNKSFLLDLLDRDEVRDGRVDVRFVDRLVARGEQRSRRHAELALVRAAIEAYEAEADADKARFLSTALRGRPEVRPEASRTVELRQAGHAYRVAVRRTAVDRYRVEENGHRVEVGIERIGSPLRERRLQTSEWRLTCGGAAHRVLSLVQGRAHLVEVEGVPHTFTRDVQGLVTASAPAIVVSVAVKPGDEVRAGQPLLVVEAMKMETSVDAPVAGRVREVHVVPNVQVGPGDPLVVVDPEPLRADGPRDARLHLDALGPAAGPPAGVAQALEELRGLMLGFDVEATGLRDALARPLDGGSAEAFARGAVPVLDIFADVASLFRRRGEDRGEEWDEGPGAEEYLFTYLRKIDERGAGLPDAFLGKLRRALRHYGVGDLLRSPELEESLYRICKAHQREEQLAGPVSQLLGRFLEGDALALGSIPQMPSLLDRLIAATQSRYPAVNDLAREVRYRLLERPLIERVRSRAFAGAEQDLAALAGATAPADRAALVHSLVQCPQPLAPMLTGRWATASAGAREAILEVLLRRFYRIRPLEEVRAAEVDGQAFVRAVYTRDGGTRLALVTHAGAAPLEASLERMARLAGPAPAETELVGDVFVWRSDGPGDADASAEAIRDRDRGGAPAAAVPAHRRRGGGAAGHAALHLPPRGGRRIRRGGVLPRGAPDDGEAPAAAPAPALRPRAAPVGGGRVPLPGGGEGQPARRAPVRGRGGPRPHARARGERARRAAPRARADAAAGPRRDPRRPGPPRARAAAAGQPRDPARLAGVRSVRGRPARLRRAVRARDGGPRPRGRHDPGPRAGAGRRAAGDGAAPLEAAGPSDRRRAGRRRRGAHRAAVGVRAEGAPARAARPHLPVRARAHARPAARSGGGRVSARRVRRARPRLVRAARARGAAVRREQGERDRGARPQLHGALPGGHDPGAPPR